jgi:hypothetical protein
MTALTPLTGKLFFSKGAKPQSKKEEKLKLNCTLNLPVAIPKSIPYPVIPHSFEMAHLKQQRPHE